MSQKKKNKKKFTICIEKTTFGIIKRFHMNVYTHTKFY